MSGDDEFAPPVEAAPVTEDGDDVGEIRVPPILPLAAFVALVSALFTLAAGIQGLVAIEYSPWGWLQYGPYLYTLFGLAGLAFGGQVYTGRVLGAALALLNLLASAGFAALWSLYHLYYGAIVPLPLFAAAIAGLAALLVGIAMPSCIRLSSQRARLYA
ncbi:MAG: hypothetical protein EP330_24875 [Deltaproteobacteria bacterium]|nr:MAG: hypothetical protein EP330_24875 [Deltaproteobacteria bacterium]